MIKTLFLSLNSLNEKSLKISKSTFIEEIVEKYPSLVRPLRERGIVCIRCGEPVWGTLEQVAEEKGIEDIDGLVDDLNRMIEEI
ncbi:DUF1858 domain-containing protein [bacterium]|nr:DUF1858 domain-containing protein [bacterium]